MRTMIFSVIFFIAQQGAVQADEMAGRLCKDVYTPIVHQKYWQLEKELFGYQPLFRANVVSFDGRNRPYIRSYGYVQTLDEQGGWVKLDFTASIKAAYPKWDGNFVTMTDIPNDAYDEHVVFDNDGVAYMQVGISKYGRNKSNIDKSLFLVSKDYCRSWKCYEIPANPRFAKLEHKDAFNDIQGPPVILATVDYGFNGEGKDATLFIVPRIDDAGDISFTEPIELCRSGAVMAFHSGDTNITMTKNGKTFIMYADLAYSRQNNTPGTAAFARTYDHKTNQMSEPVYIGLGGDYVDGHNWPALQMDSKGFLHALLGSHHEPFKYVRSVNPLSAEQWTEPVEIGLPKRKLGERSYTYPGFLIDRDDTMHVVSRWGGTGCKQFLAYEQKPAGGDWQPMQILVEPFTNLYANWDHKINMDQFGRLFINYSAYTNQELRPDEAKAYKEMFPQDNAVLPEDIDKRANGMYVPQVNRHGYCMLISEDFGKSWRLAVTKDFAGFVMPHKQTVLSVEKQLVNSIGMKMNLVEPGGFVMGSDSGDYDETPAHKVFITRPFYLGAYEVTVGQFREFVAKTGYKTLAEDGDTDYWYVFMSGKNVTADWARNKTPKEEIAAFIAAANWKNPGYQQSDSHPVVCVNIDDARAFCKWLSEKEGRSYRLPTEAQWEYACRGGTDTQYSFAAGEKLGDHGWYAANSSGSAQPVGSKKSNPWGFYDMHGNVWEFTDSLYGRYDSRIKLDPKGADEDMGVGVSIKGGSWIDDVHGGGDGFNLRSAARNYQCYPRCKTNWIGFRVVLECEYSKSGADKYSNEPSNAKQLKEKKQSSPQAAYDPSEDMSLSAKQRAWELVLKENLGDFYYPLYLRDRAAGKEQAWDYIEDDPALPRVLVIGDSISRGYTVPVRHSLKGKANLHRAPANCGPTAYGLTKLPVWLGDGKWDMITFNFGIHDRNTPIDVYIKNLEQLIASLKKTGAKLVWVNTTPVPAGADEYIEGSIEGLNKAANELMQKNGIPVIDLNNYILPVLDQYQLPKNCHYKSEGYQYMGSFVAKCIEDHLKN